MVPVPGIFHLYLKISGSRIRMEADANPGTGSVLKRIRIKITAVQTTNLLEQTVIINKQQHQLSLSTFPLSISLSISHLDGLLWVAQIAHEDVPAPHAELPAVGAHLRHAGAGPADMGQTVHTVTLENM